MIVAATSAEQTGRESIDIGQTSEQVIRTDDSDFASRQLRNRAWIWYHDRADSAIRHFRSRWLGANSGRETLMPIAVVRLGSPRRTNEGLRLGTVRRPPRGIKKADIANRGFYDVWLPILSPSSRLISLIRNSDDDGSWNKCERRFRGELNRPEAARILDLIAALSHQTNLSVGCYCEDESRCHRSILRAVLIERGAHVV